jgi:ATP-dependent exoDNAse (exonuclease V) beta subunit
VLAGAQLDMGREDAPALKILAKEALPHDRAFLLEKEGWKRALNEALRAPTTGRAFRTASALEELPSPGVLARAANAAKDIGTAVHAVLERIDLATGRDIGLLSEEEADRIGRPDLVPEIRDLVQRTLRSDVVREALAAPRLERELPFAAAGDTWITEGRADMVFEEGGGLTIVDFKTDKVSTKEEIDARMETYRPQALLYARALHLVTELPIRRVILHFIRPGTHRTFKVDESFLNAGRTLLERGTLEAETGSANEA